MLYHSLIYSKLQYGILVWGTASKTHLRELMVRLTSIVHIIAFSRNCNQMSNLYKSLYLLKLTDIQGGANVGIQLYHISEISGILYRSESNIS